MQDDTVRLQKFLSARGIASRRHAAEMISAGRVTVNGSVCTEPGLRIRPGVDAVTCDGTPVEAEPAPPRTIMLNKPRGYICSASEKDGRTVFELLDGIEERLVPVGRLDKNSEGLLLLSSDGDLVHELTHPRYEHTKIYRVSVSGDATEEALRALNEPMVIDDYTTRAARVINCGAGPLPGRTILEFQLREGRNRQIRKMCEAVGLKVHRLAREAIGHLTLKALPAGRWRDLTQQECAALRAGGRPQRA